ncbi:MAG: polymerase sigma-70 factor, subfamily [Verrucomicrobiota bacterium]|nr:polymerase sigma-70 factor, subfamily [Verrucomicrobiota bacterium]
MPLNELDERASKLEAGHSPNDLVEPDDRVLVQRCQAGDSNAFNELVIRYRNKTFMMVYGMVQNEQDAWDLAQEGFLKAWKSIHRFKGQSSFYTWLYRIMTNVTIDSLRRKGIHGEAEFDDRIAPANVEPGSRTTPSAVPLPHIKLEQNEIRQRIDEAILRLSPEHRAVIVMKEIEDLQYSEIAEILNCSLGTVMSRLFYARKKLQILLRDVYENL